MLKAKALTTNKVKTIQRNIGDKVKKDDNTANQKGTI